MSVPRALVHAQESIDLSESKPQWSGIYPHLAFFNQENECGTGAVVPWAGSLWAVTYSPHSPRGSTDKLYQITEDLKLVVRGESIGGTPANRMIHRESGQLFIGPYAISRDGDVRTIPYSAMFGRPTGTARHLFHPESKVYYATMEEGFYSVDVATLEVNELFRDEQLEGGRRADLPGYHGKGLYTGQGRLIYANNGEHGSLARTRPDIPSGCLAEWDGRSDSWKVIRRNQFTEVTGPGGIYGNPAPDSDPVWSIGWDHRSLILMLLDDGEWHSFRLPKSSHSYDGAHGWNTEWPRIRDAGLEGRKFLMTMHGAFWEFPQDFSAGTTGGIRPLSNYLKVVGDFCEWQDMIVLGCDDTARNEFLNTRKAKGKIAAPQSQSNLWFVEKDRIDGFGPVIGRGAVWLRDEVSRGEVSDPYLIHGYDRKGLHLHHASDKVVSISIEVDPDGSGNWRSFRTLTVAPGGYRWEPVNFPGVWLRLRANTDIEGATAFFNFANADNRPDEAAPVFNGLATPEATRSLNGGIIRARGENTRSLHFASITLNGSGERIEGYYEMNGDMKLRRVDAPDTRKWLVNNAAIPAGVLVEDQASILFVDDSGNRFRLPRSGDAHNTASGPLGPQRVDREVSTERDLFNCGGTFFELPAENAGGFSKVRPVATHNRRIIDYCSYRGLLVMSGIEMTEEAHANPHIIKSDDGHAGLWVGAVDDLWQFGKPRGKGGPWMASRVQEGEISDPYLMTGYDRKSMVLTSDSETTITVQVDLDGSGHWVDYRDFSVTRGAVATHRFDDSFHAYWIRFKSSRSATVTAQLNYN